jgi:ABC-type uncharacterized transport system fused permease/ATPase subunit
VVIAANKLNLTQLLEMRWRAWMTGFYLDRWLANYLHLLKTQKNTDLIHRGRIPGGGGVPFCRGRAALL